MLLRFAIFLLISGVLTSCTTVTPRTTNLTEVRIKEVKPRYMESTDFARLTEFYSGREVTGRRMILRSDPNERAGFYFTLVLDAPLRKLPRGTQIRAEVFTPFENTPQTVSVTLPRERPRTREVFVGLTGDDWPEPGGMPSAWKFTVLSPRGAILGTYESFLWSQ